MSDQQPDPASGLPHGANLGGPQHIYGGSGPAGGPYIPAPRRSNAWPVLIGLLAFIVIICGGCLTLGLATSLVGGETGDSTAVESQSAYPQWPSDEPGMPVVALRKVRAGQAFTVEGYAVLAGWTPNLDGTVSDLRVKSRKGNTRSGNELIFRFADGNGNRAEASCPLDVTREPTPVICLSIDNPVLDKIRTIKAGLR